MINIGIIPYIPVFPVLSCPYSNGFYRNSPILKYVLRIGYLYMNFLFRLRLMVVD